MLSTPGPLLSLDLAHPARKPADVESELTDNLARVRNSSVLRVVKIIHGYGSHGRGGTARELVRNWAFAHRRRLRAVIAGEQYGVHDPVTRSLRQDVGPYDDQDLDNHNQGITILWVK